MGKNARFWVNYGNGFVKLTLKPGDEVSFGWVTPHDEGWSSRHIELSYDEDVVTKTVYTDGRDCDGRLSSTTVLSCHVDKLRKLAPYDANDPDYCPEPGAKFPDWEKKRYRQRDYTAERMGY